MAKDKDMKEEKKRLEDHFLYNSAITTKDANLAHYSAHRGLSPEKLANLAEYDYIGGYASVLERDPNELRRYVGSKIGKKNAYEELMNGDIEDIVRFHADKSTDDLEAFVKKHGKLNYNATVKRVKNYDESVKKIEEDRDEAIEEAKRKITDKVKLNGKIAEIATAADLRIEKADEEYKPVEARSVLVPIEHMVQGKIHYARADARMFVDLYFKNKKTEEDPE